MLVCFSLTLELHRIREHMRLLPKGLAKGNQDLDTAMKRDRKEENMWQCVRG